MADVSRETLIFTVIFCCFALSSMTATLCGLIGSASLSLRSRTMLMVAVCGLSFFVAVPSQSLICRSPFFWGSFLSTNSTCDGDRNIRKTRLPSRSVTSRTATVDYERGERFVFCRKPLVRSGANKIQVCVLCLPTIIAVSSVAAENERIPPYNCVCGVETTARSRM